MAYHFNSNETSNTEFTILSKYGSFSNLKKQAEKGDGDAKLFLSHAYLYGIPEWGITKDLDKAIGWQESEVDDYNKLRSSASLHQLAVLYDLKEDRSSRRKAYELYHEAAELGSVHSELNLAEIYRCGLDGVVEEDIEEAFRWYKRAAGEEQTLSENPMDERRLLMGTSKMLAKDISLKALKQLFSLYKSGECPERFPQLTKAFYYVNRAAELGDVEAQRKLGLIWLVGDCGKEVDVKQAKRWLKKAAEKGDVEAKKILTTVKNERPTDVVSSSVNNGKTRHDRLQSQKEVWDMFKEKIFPVLHKNALHPYIMNDPVIFHEEMFLQHPQSPTAMRYLKAYKLAQDGFKLLCSSNFTDILGFNLIAQSYLCQCTILNGFPQYRESLYEVTLRMIFENDDPKFYEGLLMVVKFSNAKKSYDLESNGIDLKKIMALKNLIHFIKKSEPDWQSVQGNRYEFGKNCSSWLHALYYHLASLYTVAECFQWGADAFQKALECCPAYYEAKIGLGYCLLKIYLSKKLKEEEKDTTGYSSLNEQMFAKYTPQPERIEKTSIYAWSLEKLSRETKEALMDYLKEAPECDQKYPNGCYHLAYCYLMEMNFTESLKWKEKGQDAEEKRLPFFPPVDTPSKHFLLPLDSLPRAAKVKKTSTKCSSDLCNREYAEGEKVMNCPCKMATYCNSKCQKEDWKKHKKICTEKSKSGFAMGKKARGK